VTPASANDWHDRQDSVLDLLTRLLSVPSEQTALMEREPAVTNFIAEVVASEGNQANGTLIFACCTAGETGTHDAARHILDRLPDDIDRAARPAGAAGRGAGPRHPGVGLGHWPAHAQLRRRGRRRRHRAGRHLRGRHPRRDNLFADGLAVPEPGPITGIYPDLSHAEDWDRAIDATSWVPDDFLAQWCAKYCIIGTARDAAAQIAQLESYGVTSLYIRGFYSYELPAQLCRRFSRDVIGRT
jgi:hypothetical protein